MAKSEISLQVDTSLTFLVSFTPKLYEPSAKFFHIVIHNLDSNKKIHLRT